uniref:Uncharacterized protein n=1 Tax=Anopheles culicifacies TaxID=139723 RepID=A0A182M8B4_9DIPT
METFRDELEIINFNSRKCTTTPPNSVAYGTMNEIIILSEGYSKYDGEAVNPMPDTPMLANCTCTLIKGPDCNVIVDTMTPWDGDLLLQRKYLPISANVSHV